jgi:hypothetical protein
MNAELCSALLARLGHKARQGQQAQVAPLAQLVRQVQLERRDLLELMPTLATTRWKVMGLHHAILGIRSLAAAEAAVLIPTTS